MALVDELYFEDSKLVVLKTLLNGIIIVTLPLLIIITLGDCKFQVFSQWQLQGNVLLQKKLFADEDSDDNNMSSGISSSESEGDGDDEGDGNNKDISLEDAAPLFSGEILAQNELELDETNFDVAPLPVNRVRICDGVPRRHGVRIRGGKRRRMFMGATPADLKTHRQEELENIWIEQDAEPEIPNFTGNAGIKVQPLENPNIFDIFQLFVTDELYDILVEQTNMYAAQYIDSHP